VSGVFVAGHRGLVGSAISRALRNEGIQPIERTRAELDLLDQRRVHAFLLEHRPDVVFIAAAKVGGIHANNTYRWDFIYENLVIEANLLGAALAADVRRVVFLGSTCIYPRESPQPMKEEHLLTGPLETTNEPYAIAKIAGVKLVEAANMQHGRAWISLMPTNLYGPGDNFDLQNSHVLPAMIRKFHDAKVQRKTDGSSSVTLWGTGSARREFLHVDDLARAAVHTMDRAETGLFNVGTGEEISIRRLAQLIATTVGYDGPVTWDATKPDGTPRKLVDSSRFRGIGWAPSISLDDGLRGTYEWYLRQAPGDLRR
jgi:GDP-L-fucose synthase